MRIWTIVKIICALIVCAIVALSTLFTMHVLGKPIPPYFTQLFTRVIPDPTELAKAEAEGATEAPLEGAEMLDIEPGDKAFQKAAELLAMGKTKEAREKLLFLINYYPSSNAASRTKQILGEMNMDDFLTVRNNPHAITHKVQRGDSYLALVNKHQTTLDMLMHINGFLDMRPLQPGDEFLLMPLNLRVTIEPKNQALTLWNKGEFLKEYRILTSFGKITAPIVGTVENKGGVLDGMKVAPAAKQYRAALKNITLSRGFTIMAKPTGDETLAKGYFLSPSDLEELSLLLRVGNEVEIRP